MTKTGDKTVQDSDKALEQLLGQASPRPTPSAEASAKARLAVQGEWQQLTKKRVGRRRLQMFAVAASVVLAVTVVMNTWLAPAVVPVHVATVDKATGAIYVMVDQSELQQPASLSEIVSGQTIVTGDDASLGLLWSAGGSLRLDANTEMTFVSEDRVELTSGRIYFDSMQAAAGESLVTIGTEHGDVTHLGTQFMAATNHETLTVSVREGQVAIDGRLHEEVTAIAGESVLIRGGRRPERLNIVGFSQQWRWVEAAAPVTDMQGKTLREFLEWVSRETGYEMKFDTENFDPVVLEAIQRGKESEAPRVALGQRLLANDLEYYYDIENGAIHISQLQP